MTLLHRKRGKTFGDNNGTAAGHEKAAENRFLSTSVCRPYTLGEGKAVFTSNEFDSFPGRCFARLLK